MEDETSIGAGAPEPPPAPARADPIAGEFVTGTFEYDGGREVTVYVPPAPPEAVVFAGDGQSISQWGGYLEAADVAPTLIVGVHSLTHEMPRLDEYSPVRAPTSSPAPWSRFFWTTRPGGRRRCVMQVQTSS